MDGVAQRATTEEDESTVFGIEDLWSLGDWFGKFDTNDDVMQYGTITIVRVRPGKVGFRVER